MCEGVLPVGEGFELELGPWTVLGRQALTQQEYAPDFDAVALGPCRLLRLTRPAFLAALEATQVPAILGQVRRLFRLSFTLLPPPPPPHRWPFPSSYFWQQAAAALPLCVSRCQQPCLPAALLNVLNIKMLLDRIGMCLSDQIKKTAKTHTCPGILFHIMQMRSHACCTHALLAVRDQGGLIRWQPTIQSSLCTAKRLCPEESLEGVAAPH